MDKISIFKAKKEEAFIREISSETKRVDLTLNAVKIIKVKLYRTTYMYIQGEDEGKISLFTTKTKIQMLNLTTYLRRNRNKMSNFEQYYV